MHELGIVFHIIDTVEQVGRDTRRLCRCSPFVTSRSSSLPRRCC